MNTIQDTQRKIQRELLRVSFLGDTGYMKDQLLSLIMEATEAMNELPWKSWKKNQTFNMERMIEELVDVQLFQLNILNALGVPHDEFVELCEKKQQENINRFTSGY